MMGPRPGEPAISGAFSALAAQSPDPIIVSDTEGVVLFANQAGRMLLDPTEPGAPSPSLLERVHPADREVFRTRAQALRSGHPEDTGAVIRLRHTGSGQATPLHLVRLLGVDGRPHLLLRPDPVPAPRENDPEATGLRRSALLGELVSGVGHEFNNLLTTIRGSTDLVLDAALPGETRARHEADLRRAIDRAAQLTRQLLDLRLRRTQEPQPYDLNQLIRGIEGLLVCTAGGGVLLSVVADPAAPPAVGDPGDAELVLLTLAAAARKVGAPSGILELTLGSRRLSAREAGAWSLAPGVYVQLRVRGIRGRSAGLADDPVLGRDFAGLRQVMESARGRLEVTNAVDGAPEVVLTFPAMTPGTRGQTGQETILVVDDEPALRRLSERILLRAGYQVRTGCDAAEILALAEALEGPATLLITDLSMPGVPGDELARRLRRTQPDLRVLFVSGNMEGSGRADATSLPGSALLAKPYTQEELLRAVHVLLGEDPPPV